MRVQRECIALFPAKNIVKKWYCVLLFHSAKGRRNGFPNLRYNPVQRISIGEESPFAREFGHLSAATRSFVDVSTTTNHPEWLLPTIR